MREKLFKKKYFFKFLKRLKRFILYKFNLQRIYRKYFSFFRIHLVYLNLIPSRMKLNILKNEDLKIFSEKELKKVFKTKNVPSLASLLIKEAKKGNDVEENLIKAAWFISFKEDKKYNIEYLINEIESLNINFENFYYLIYTLAFPFHYVAAYYRAEKLEKELKLIFDRKNKRSLSLIYENQYFTAIGHIALIFFLINAVESKLVDTSKTPISLVYDPDKLANNEYANLLAELCPKYGIKIINPSNLKSNKYQPNIELWPSYTKNEYLIARHYYGFAYNEAFRINKEFHLKPKNYHLKVAQDIIKSHSLKINKWFVGMHLRHANDGEELRNPSPEIYR